MVERRRFPRIEVDLRVICRPEGEPEMKIDGRSIDISLGGIGLNTKTPFPGNSRALVTVYRRFWQGKIKGKGDVVWSDRLPSGEGRMGVSFTEIAWAGFGKFLSQVATIALMLLIF